MQCPKKYLKDDWMISIYLQNLFNKFSPIFIHVHAHNKQRKVVAFIKQLVDILPLLIFISK